MREKTAKGVLRKAEACVRLATLGLLLAAPAGAQVFTPPPGCTGFLTVQARGCKVSNHYRCAGDTPGDQWRVDFGTAGPYFVSRIDFETQWVQSIDLVTGIDQTLAPDPADAASFSGLLRTGTDTFDFHLNHGDGRRTRVRGFDTLTGRKVVIDGIELEETSFEFREADAASGAEIDAARGREFIHRDWRLFFSGPSEWSDGSGWQPYDRSPVLFSQPGQPGFMATEPKFDCDDQLAGLQGDKP